MKKYSFFVTMILMAACVGCAENTVEQEVTNEQVQVEEKADKTEAEEVQETEPEAIENEVSDADAPVEYDMYGYVVDKLPTDEYYNHYNVKGDNDEIYICNYNGDDELTEGTYVGMWQIGDGWTLEVIGDDGSAKADGAVITDENGSTVSDVQGLEDLLGGISLEEYTQMMVEQAKAAEKANPVKLEKKESSKDVNPIDGGLFITSDKVECRSLKLSCSNNVYSFGVELYNETGSDKTFDQTKFVIEIKDGEYVNPFVFAQLQEPETVSGEMKRLWMAYNIYDPKDLKVGDEVSVYYDGVFITKLTVEQ